ncbi:MAG: toll/interleukin-1 receptor domain-containing protein, partial [Nitrososphaerota archaeon]
APGALPPDVVGAPPQAQPSAPPATRGGTPPASETLQFSAYHPNEAPVDVWQTLLVYAHLPEHLTQVRADAGTFTELGSSPTLAQGQSLRQIARNVEITIEPHVEGVTFSPPRDSFIWRGEWHRSLFRYSGAKALAGTAQTGWIDIYAERISPICTIEVTFSFHDGVAATSLSAPPRGMAVTTNAFDTVFISYSHHDSEAMRQALETYQKMNITVYNDDQLPSGVNYERELARMIEAANVFHLLWSSASAHSPEVRNEWLRALASRKGERFIRPWYWQQPLVTPPAEMQARRISFRYERLRRRLLRPSTWF